MLFVKRVFELVKRNAATSVRQRIVIFIDGPFHCERALLIGGSGNETRGEIERSQKVENESRTRDSAGN
jgi:hypothetical protein